MRCLLIPPLFIVCQTRNEYDTSRQKEEDYLSFLWEVSSIKCKNYQQIML